MKIGSGSLLSLEMWVKLFRNQPVNFYFSRQKAAVNPIHTFEGTACWEFSRDGLN